MSRERWVEFSAEDVPRWKRSACVVGNKVFVAAGLFGDERVQMMKILFDGGEVIQSDGHLYIPVNWVVKEYPEAKASVSAAAKKAIALVKVIPRE